MTRSAHKPQCCRNCTAPLTSPIESLGLAQRILQAARAATEYANANGNRLPPGELTWWRQSKLLQGLCSFPAAKSRAFPGGGQLPTAGADGHMHRALRRRRDSPSPSPPSAVCALFRCPRKRSKTRSDWTAPGFLTARHPHDEACSKASGLTSPRWL